MTTRKVNIGVVIDRLCRRKNLSRGKVARHVGLFDRTIRSWMDGANAGVLNVDLVLRTLGCRLAVVDDRDKIVYDEFTDASTVVARELLRSANAKKKGGAKDEK